MESDLAVPINLRRGLLPIHGEVAGGARRKGWWNPI